MRKAFSVRTIEINITETWGDIFYAGLNGLEVLDQNMQPIPIDIGSISANPRDMNSIPGYSGDYRTLEKLIDGVNNTQNDKHMWLIPYN